MYSLPDSVMARESLLRIEAEDSKHCIRPVDELAVLAIDSPTARIGQPLRFRQVSFAAPQSLFGSFAVLDVGACAVPPQDVPVLIPQRIVRIRNQRYSPSFPRIRASISIGAPSELARSRASL